MQPFASRIHGPLRAALLDLLGGAAEAGGIAAAAREVPILTVEDIAVEEWASLTFEGHRHRVELCLDGAPALVEAAAKVFAAKLGEVEFDVAGEIVADIALTSTALVRGGGRTSRRLCFEVLTIAE